MHFICTWTLNLSINIVLSAGESEVKSLTHELCWFNQQTVIQKWTHIDPSAASHAFDRSAVSPASAAVDGSPERSTSWLLHYSWASLNLGSGEQETLKNKHTNTPVCKHKQNKHSLLTPASKNTPAGFKHCFNFCAAGQTDLLWLTSSLGKISTMK